jgi:hypothetical protein
VAIFQRAKGSRIKLREKKISKKKFERTVNHPSTIFAAFVIPASEATKGVRT